MALGAQAVLRAFTPHNPSTFGRLAHRSCNNIVGRPYMYGLALGGEDGVEQVLRSILADLEVTMGLSGFRNLREIQGKREEVITKMNLEGLSARL